MTDYANLPGDAAPLHDAVDVIPDDTAEIPLTRCLYVGTGGDVAVKMRSGSDVVFKNVPDGATLPIRVSQVFETDTTASDILAGY